MTRGTHLESLIMFRFSIRGHEVKLEPLYLFNFLHFLLQNRRARRDTLSLQLSPTCTRIYTSFPLQLDWAELLIPSWKIQGTNESHTHELSVNFTGNWTVNEGTRGGVFSRNKNNWWKLEFYSFYLISCFSLCRDKSLNWHNGTKWISSGIRQKKLWLNAVWLYLLDEILIQLLPSSSWLHSERRKTRQDLLRISTLWQNIVS